MPGPAQAPPAAHPPQPKHEKTVLREYGEALLIALGLALLIRTFFVQAYKIPSGSMEPTLLVGDHILVNKIGFGLRMPESVGIEPFSIALPESIAGHYLFHLGHVNRGDVVVFVFPPDRTKDFIKRVIAVPGDMIEVKEGAVYLNGAPAADPHAHFELATSARSGYSPRDRFGPIRVPQGKFFMMGDNRDRSFDSRFWGFVDENDVEGRALIIYWSWDSDDNSLLPVRWGRLARLVE